MFRKKLFNFRYQLSTMNATNRHEREVYMTYQKQKIPPRWQPASANIEQQRLNRHDIDVQLQAWRHAGARANPILVQPRPFVYS
jgi:hypothetical protein